MLRILSTSLLSLVLVSHASCIIMRNNALMSRMISHFQGKEKTQDEPEDHRDVVSLMQHVLCKNFPSVPCEYITDDSTLRRLIEKSIKQLQLKKATLESTPSPSDLTLFPAINSEDLSNFVRVSDTGYFKPKKDKTRKKQVKKAKNYWSHEQLGKTAVISGRKSMRKFYPHKIKYKDKSKREYDNSDEKLSMSVEVPHDHAATLPPRRHFDHGDSPADPPVWRIDYMKHGEPSLNMFGYEADSLKGKIIKSGPVMVDEHVLEQVARKDVLHPDVYIKKNNYLRKKGMDGNSDGY